MVESYAVAKKPMILFGGEVRQPGSLVPEAKNFPSRVISSLLDSGLMVRVIIVSTKKLKQLEGYISPTPK